MVSPGQAFVDVNSKEPEAADSLHRSPIEFLSVSLHNQLPCFADIEMDVSVLAAGCMQLVRGSVNQLMKVLMNCSKHFMIVMWAEGFRLFG